jgi:hypothetical protein
MNPSKYPHFASVALSYTGLIEWTSERENVLNQRFDPLNRMLVKWEVFLGDRVVADNSLRSDTPSI